MRSKIKVTKTIFLIILVVAILGSFTFVVPSLANYKNKNALETPIVWEGDEATSYRMGTGSKDDPYIIANGSELSYFKTMLETTDYAGTYFKLSNDILLNEGIFNYSEEEKVTYILNGNKYYVKGSTLYSDMSYTNSVGAVNDLGSLNTFKGNLDGAFHTIYGYYSSGALFSNIISSRIENISFANMLVEGENKASILALNADDSTFKNIIISGNAKANNVASLISDASNVQIENVTTKAKLWGSENASPMVLNATGNINIANSYNAGTVNAQNTSGLISNLNNNPNVLITNYYNNGPLTGDNTYALFSSVTNIDTLNITNSFNTEVATKDIGYAENVNLTLTNYYSLVEDNNITDNTYAIIGTSIYKDNFIDSNFYNDLGFNSFISNDDVLTNTHNVWLLENDKLPILYTEKVNGSFALITVLDNSWDDIRYDISTKYINKNLTFSISGTSNIRPIKEAYYYISDKELSKEEIENIDSWTLYNSFVSLNSEGSHVIYAKVIDLFDNVNYLNSDLMLVDYSESSIVISSDDKVWNKALDTLDYRHITPESEFVIEASDSISGIKSLEYALVNSKVQDMEALSWQSVNDKIIINKAGAYIIYVKALDNAGNVTYANTDYLVYGGYTQRVSEKLNVTSNSKINYNFTYFDEYNSNITGTHHLIMNNVLPVGTKITLIDNINQQVFTYNITKITQDIPFQDFKEIGKGVMENKFLESNYEMALNEDFSVIIDLANTSPASNILDLNISLALYDGNNKVIRSTLPETMQAANIFVSKESNIVLSTDDYLQEIVYDNSFNVRINLKNDLISNTLEDIIIWEQSLDKQKLGLEVLLTNQDGNIVDKEKIKNWQFIFNDQNYSPDNDGIIRIKWQDNVINTTGILDINAIEDISLVKGEYKIQIKAITSYDGVYGKIKESNSIILPIIKASNISYGSGITFKEMDDYQVLYKKDKQKTLDYTISYEDYDYLIADVSLYKKEKLTAYDQNYVLVNNEDMPVYTLDQNEFGLRLELKTEMLEPGGYKFVFSLYDKKNKAAQYTKLFIVR